MKDRKYAQKRKERQTKKRESEPVRKRAAYTPTRCPLGPLITKRLPLSLPCADCCPGEDVYSFDFTALNLPGTYRVYVPSVGVSDAFVIADDALDFAAYTTGRGLFYQRCGYKNGHVYPFADKFYQVL